MNRNRFYLNKKIELKNPAIEYIQNKIDISCKKCIKNQQINFEEDHILYGLLSSQN